MLRRMRLCEAGGGCVRRWQRCGAGMALALGLAAAMDVAGAADPAPVADPVVRKSQEVERLQQELQKAKDELGRLQQENQELRKTAATNSPAPAAPNLLELAPLQESDLVPATDLAAHYETDPAAAARRYDGRVLQVTGEIDGFDRPLVERVYLVKLVVPKRHPVVVAKFNYLDRYKTVFTRDGGRTLVGRMDERSVRTLYRAGEQVVLQGRCKGLVDGTVMLTGCSRVK